ncbi:TIGR04372 family glycosyltransferase [Candidatus Pelagibacter sp.]|nr:TIGR04372 family glycosyltransferase [Candidatus Pelagibacter sp.]|tara:strand:- start:285 stop:1526 length:1242 start_codon:yes stop_codon:yes gene_type:complete
MKKKIEKKLFGSNYLILTPKIHSFGGFFESFLFGLKIKNFYNKKLILAIPFIDIFKHYKIDDRKFDYDLILKVFFKLSFKEKIYSIFFSIWLNLNLILIRFKFRTLLKIIFKINNIDDIIFYKIGFSDKVENNYNNYNLDNYNLVYQADISEYLNNKSNSKIQNSQRSQKKICFCVKDKNYQKIKPISLNAVANIENYRESLVYLLNNEYSIFRVGDSMMSKFSLDHKNYTDTTGLKNSYKELKDNMLKSNIYFGTSGSHTYAAELYNLKKIISNSIDFQYLCASFNLNNWTIFKKIFDLKQKKFLSLYEIYELYNLIETDEKRFIYIENDKEEIFDLLKNALNGLVFNKKHEERLKDFHEIRNHCVKKLKLLNKPSKLYEQAKTNIPFKYLENYLYQNSNLNELSLKFYKNI